MSEREGYLRIGELARRTGTSPELLRAWEQRYGLLRPTRSEGGFRLYSDRDEERVLRTKTLIAEGLGNAQIAGRLGISEKTVRNHVSNLFDKLGVWTRAQAIVFAHERGFRA